MFADHPLTRGADGKPTWAYRYRVEGRGSARPQVGGFASQGDALQGLQVALERLRRRKGRLAQITLSELAEEYLAQHEAEPRTIAKLRWLLAKATCEFGDWPVVELRSDEIGAWRTTLPEGHRFEATQALCQLLSRAVAWKIIDSNPAKAGVDNPRRQHPEKRPFKSWAEIDAIAEHLGPVYGPMVVFAAATGLRPGEWIALEQRDADRDARVVYVRRSFAHRRLKGTKTRRSMRAVPLQAIARAASWVLLRSRCRRGASLRGTQQSRTNHRSPQPSGDIPEHWRRSRSWFASYSSSSGSNSPDGLCCDR
jgi:hypothetical protein